MRKPMKNSIFNQFKIEEFSSGAVYLVAKDRNETASDRLYLGSYRGKTLPRSYDVIVTIEKTQTALVRCTCGENDGCSVCDTLKETKEK